MTGISRAVLNLTQHAKQRMIQRGITHADIDFTIEYGERIYRQGLIFCVMLDKVAQLRGGSARHSARHMVVLLSHDQNIITAYKDRNAFKKIKRAVKYDLKRELRL